MNYVDTQKHNLHKALLTWYRHNARDLPWRTTNDPYAILVSEVMLQQTQVARVIPKYHQFLQRFPSFSALEKSPRSEVIRVWAPLGYNVRAVYLHELAQQVVHIYDGQLPREVAELRRLRGLGRYTAAAIASLAYGKDVAVVDTNVRRILTRLFTRNPNLRENEIWELAQTIAPSGRTASWNQALMDLGATVCLKSRPDCNLCPLKPYCKTAHVLEGNDNNLAGSTTTCVGKRQPRFQDSNRYYRGRIVDLLRRAKTGQGLTLLELGNILRPDFESEHIAWLEQVILGLERDGLTRMNTGTFSKDSVITLA